MGVLTECLFWVTASTAMLSALLVTLQKKVVYSALFLVLHFFSLAILYLLLSAPFVAIAQVLIYAGAIMILFLFVVMLIGPAPDLLPIKPLSKIGAGFFGLVFLLFLGSALLARGKGIIASPTLAPDFGSVQKIGGLLFSRYTLFFELVSVLLLIAMIGVVVLGRKPVKEKK